MFDAAVIGAGPNGLAAAIQLAQAGRSVVVYEAQPQVGGSALSAELTLPGFVHDVGSAFHPMGRASPYLSTLPLAEHGLEWVEPAATVSHPLEDGRSVCQWVDVARTAEHLEEPGYADFLAPVLDDFHGLLADAMGPLGVPNDPAALTRFGLRAMQPLPLLVRTLNPRTQALLAGYAAHSLIPIQNPPAAAIALMLLGCGHTVGFPFPRGGAHQISLAMARLFESLGGEIRLGHAIEHLNQVDAHTVFFNTSPRAMARIAGDHLPANYAAKLRRYRRGPGIFKLDYALSEPVPWADPVVAQAPCVHVGGTLAEIRAAEDTVWRGGIAERPYLLVGQHSLFDDTRAPKGRHTLWVYGHVPNGCDVDQTAVIEAQLERYAPGFGDTILARHATNASALEALNPNYVGGDINGGRNTLDNLFTRPLARMNPYSTPNPRVFLCSAATPPGGGVHGMCGVNAVLSSGLVG